MLVCARDDEQKRQKLKLVSVVRLKSVICEREPCPCAAGGCKARVEKKTKEIDLQTSCRPILDVFFLISRMDTKKVTSVFNATRTLLVPRPRNPQTHRSSYRLARTTTPPPSPTSPRVTLLIVHRSVSDYQEVNQPHPLA